jgi:DNA-binding ferritin-like protein
MRMLYSFNILSFLPHNIFGRSSPDNPANRQAASARKHLLEAFADYDALAKRIRKLPCTAGSSQDRLQQAILTRANLFLQKNMFPLQVNHSFPLFLHIN